MLQKTQDIVSEIKDYCHILGISLHNINVIFSQKVVENMHFDENAWLFEKICYNDTNATIEM